MIYQRTIAAVSAAISMAVAAVALAQTTAPIAHFTATTENVSGAPDSIRIDLFRWSTDAERDQLLAAWNLTGPSPEAGRGRGAPSAVRENGSPAPAAGRGGRGGRGRGGAEAVPRTPEASLAAALERAPTLGYLWSSEVAGYAIRFAGKVDEPNGAERIILITNRRLGANTINWKPVASAEPSTYDFSVIELHVNAKGQGEGKISLTGKVAPDSATKMLAPENYAALPVVLRNLKRKLGGE